MAGFWNSDFLEEEDAFQYCGNDYTRTDPVPELPASEFSYLDGLLDWDGVSTGYDRRGAFNQPDRILSQSSFSIASQINQPEYLGSQLPYPIRSGQYFSQPSNTMAPQTNQLNPDQLSEAEKRAQKAAKRKITDKKYNEKKKQMKNEMEDKIEDLNETIKTLMGRIRNLEEGRERYEAELTSLTKVKDELRSDLEKSESINKDQVNLVQDLSKQLDQLRSELDKSESKRLEQDYQITFLKEQVEKLRSELARPTSDKNYLQSLLPYNSPELKGLRKAQANIKKVILKLEVQDERSKKKAMKIVSSLSGVEAFSMEMKDTKLTVIGDVDAVVIVQKLRKVCSTEIISVGPVKESEKKKEEAKKEEPKKADRKKDPVAELVSAFKAYNPYMPRHYPARNVEEDPIACVIC